MHAALLSSCGLALSLNHSTILVDLLNSSVGGFREIADSDFRSILACAPPYDHISGLFYTHLHPDHFDPDKNRIFLSKYPSTFTFIPSTNTPESGVLEAGPFKIAYHLLEHIPCPSAGGKHYVFWIEGGGTAVYITGDAKLDAAEHRRILHGRRADCSFWNSKYLSYPETRTLLRESAKKVLIYHMPDAETDQTGIGRKAARNLDRFPDELSEVTVLDHYPAFLEL